MIVDTNENEIRFHQAILYREVTGECLLFYNVKVFLGMFINIGLQYFLLSCIIGHDQCSHSDKSCDPSNKNHSYSRNRSLEKPTERKFKNMPESENFCLGSGCSPRSLLRKLYNFWARWTEKKLFSNKFLM